MFFRKQYNTEVNGSFYNVYVEGVCYYDSEDKVMYSDVDTIAIIDEDEEIVDEEHPDYDDLHDEVMNTSFEPDMWG